MAIELDPRFTFDAFVVGPANRLAAAAAGRVAESPGTSYNPLVIYGGSGLGKTHLLSAIGNQVRRLHDVDVRYETAEHLMEGISRAVEAGDRDALRGQLRNIGLLLLDDIQFLAGHRQTQEELIRVWDSISARGGQVVLTSDRPPQDMDALDDRLLSRLSGGLIVDMGAPDYETRIAIARRKADERGQSLSAAVFQVLARIAFTNVRELQGALNRLIAVQELERRTVTAEEVTALLGAAAADRGRDEFGEFLSDIAGTVTAVVGEAEQRLADAIMAWEGEGFRTRRLEGALSDSVTPAQATELVRRFELDAGRLRQIESEVRALDPEARELHRLDVLRDPDRVSEAEGVLAAVRERQVPPPAPPAGHSFDDMDDDTLAVRAARAVAAAPGTAYNPLYVVGPESAGKTALLAALGNEMARSSPDLTVGYIDGHAFAAELVDALERNRLEAWRARYRSADTLLLDGMDAFAGTERAQEELFHLFEDLYRAGKQLVFAARVPPQDLPLPQRLRSRLESGLVVELVGPAADGAAGPAAVSPPARRAAAEAEAGAEMIADGLDAAVPAAEPPPVTGAPAPEPPNGDAGSLILSREKVLWEWPYPGDWIEESVD